MTVTAPPTLLNCSYPHGPARNALDRAHRLLESHDANAAMQSIRELRDAASALRRASSGEADWQRVVHTWIRTHPVFPVVQEDPFIRRAFQKPRGYAGDAVLLDFIYHHPANLADLEQATPRGRAATGYSTNSPAPRAVRNRAWLLAQEIDNLCRRTTRPEILSVACGHLREASHSTAVRSRAVGRYVALDHDPATLAVVGRDLAADGVEPVEGSVKTLIARGRELGRFDFVYAAGLYDYLSDKVAARLLRALFDLVKPGGKLWIASFLPGIPDTGFMEAFMDWWLIYRTPAQLESLSAVLPREQLSWRRTFVEPEENVVFLEAARHA